MIFKIINDIPMKQILYMYVYIYNVDHTVLIRFFGHLFYQMTTTTMMISVNIYIEVNVENTIYSIVEKDKWRATQVKNKPLSLRVCDYSEKKIVTKKSKININKNDSSIYYTIISSTLSLKVVLVSSTICNIIICI